MGSQQSSMVPAHVQAEAHAHIPQILARLNALLGNPYTTQYELDLLEIYIRHHIFLHFNAHSLPLGNNYMQPMEHLAVLAQPLAESFFLESKDQVLNWRYDRSDESEPLQARDKVRGEVHGLMRRSLLLCAEKREFKPWMEWILRWRLEKPTENVENVIGVERRFSDPGHSREGPGEVRVRSSSLPVPLGCGGGTIWLSDSDLRQHLLALQRDIEEALARKAGGQAHPSPHVHFADQATGHQNPEDQKEQGYEGEEPDHDGFPTKFWDPFQKQWRPIEEWSTEPQFQDRKSAMTDEEWARRVAQSIADGKAEAGNAGAGIDANETYEADEGDVTSEPPVGVECPYGSCG